MTKTLKIRDSEPSHIPPYKRSIGEQSTTTRGSRRSVSANRTSYQKAAPSTWIGLGVMLLFIAYWLLPWDRLSLFFKTLTEPSYESYQSDPLLYRTFSEQNPMFSGIFSGGASSESDNNMTVLFNVKSGDSLRSLLERYGVSSDQAGAAHDSLIMFQKEKAQKNLMKTGSVLEGTFLPDTSLASIRIKLSNDESLILQHTAQGVFTPSISKIETALRERIVIGTIQSSFAAAARKAGLGYDMVDDLVDIFSDRISFHRDFRKGDRFSLIYHEREQLEGSGTSSGPILAAALEVRGSHFTAIRYVGADGKARYFNEDGTLIGNTFLRYPLKFSRISSHFSDGRLHPVLKVKRPHNGVDFAAPTGTPVRTVGDGVVTFAGRKGGHGIIIEIKHSDRYTTGYSHLSAISPGIVRGKKVSKGTLIGKVGMTGLATGPHLHFSLYDYGKYVDPLKAKLPKSEMLRSDIKISPLYLARARYTLEHYQNIADTKVLQP